LLIFWRIGTVNPEGRAYRLRRRANTIGEKTSALLIAVMERRCMSGCRSREDYNRPIAGAKIADRIATGEWTTAAARGYPGQRLSVHAA
jgi:hypothetical protein